MANKIRINFDSVDHIAHIPGIGEKIASKILILRQKKRFLRSPKDLAKIEGISLKTAQQLENIIDWTAPFPEKGWNLGIGYVYITLFSSLILVLNLTYIVINRSIPDLILESQRSSPNILALILNYGRDSFAMINRVCLSVGLAQFLAILALNKGNISTEGQVSLAERLIKFVLIAVIFQALIMFFDILHIVFFLIGFPLKNPFPQGILLLILREGLACAAACFFWLCFWHPTKLNNKESFLVADIILVSGILLEAYISLKQAQMGIYSIYSELFHFFIVLVVTLVAIQVNRMGTSISEYFYRQGINRIFNNSNTVSEFWIMWLNKRLPDRDQQKALRDVLNTVYPPSRTKTIVNWLFLVFGGWLLVSIAQSILDYFVQNILSNLLP